MRIAHYPRRNTGFQRPGYHRAVVIAILALLVMAANSSGFVPVRLTSDPAYDGNPYWSVDGKHLVFTSDRAGYYNIWKMSADGSNSTAVTTGAGSDYAPVLSPDGNTVAFFRYSGGNADIYTVPIAGGTPTRLTSDPASDAAPYWSPDGSQIVFHSDRSGNFDLWIMPATGGSPTQLTTDPANDFAPSWSPDGGSIAFSSNRAGNRDLWLIPAAGGTASPLVSSPAEEDEPRWSPDGSMIAYNVGPHGSRDIWTVPATGGPATQITSDPADDGTATWSADGSRLAFHSNRSGKYDIWMIPISQFTKTSVTGTPSQGDITLGVCWVDVDNDTDQDLYVTNLGSGSLAENRLFINDGSGHFTEMTGDPLVDDQEDSRSGAWADYDNDGDMDVYVTNFGWTSNSLYVNDGGGVSFAKQSAGPPVIDAYSSFNAGWADYDNDGDLDLYVVNENDQVPPPGPAVNHLYRNDGGTFTKVTTGSPVTDAHASQALAWADYDDDGDQDLYVTSSSGEDNNLYRNNGDGTFTAVTGSVVSSDGGASFSPVFADLDNDGDLDLFVTTAWGSADGRDCLYANEGDGTFVKVTDGALVSDSTLAACGTTGDFDNDGDLDLLVTGRPYLHLYENRGGLSFTRMTEGIIATDSARWYAASWCDGDADGDLDLFVTDPGNGPGSLYVNNGNANNWITLRLTGTVSNRSAVGARVRIKATISSSPVWQRRDIATNSGAWSQSSLNQHFGLGDATNIDSIRVEWPSGIVQVLTDVAVDQFLTIEETCCGLYTGGYTGNTNCSPDGKRNLSDITRLIDYVYIDQVSLCCPANGNTSGDEEGKINLIDITELIDHVYINQNETAACD